MAGARTNALNPFSIVTLAAQSALLCIEEVDNEAKLLLTTATMGGSDSWPHF
jgi:hypothetical protein